MGSSDRPFCAEMSREGGEPLVATASRVDNWILVEYRGLWSRDALAGSGLSDQAKGALREQADRPRTKVLFIRRRERREGLAVFVGRTAERGSTLFRLELGSYEELARLDLAGPGFAGSPVEHPLLLVCTHGKHDRCCARYGRPLYDALREQLDEEWVWQVSHVGGDRFAGNLVVLPEGLYYGRVRPEDAWPLLDDHLAGRIHLERFRGRSCYPFPVQAADAAIRDQAGLRRIDELSFVGAKRGAETWLMRFVVPETGVRYEVEVRAETGELTYLTCSARSLRRPRRFVVVTAPG